jgi:hypothetical protein
MAVLVQNHDLSVKNCRTLQPSQRFHDQWKSFLEIVPLAAISADAASVVSFRNRPEAVPAQTANPDGRRDRGPSEPP